MKAKVYGLINEKGGVGKSTTAATAAYVLAKQGKKVLLIDFGGQGHASLLCGVPNINKLPTTTATLMNAITDGKALPEPESYLHHHAGVDLVPSNSQLFALERIERTIAFSFPARPYAKAFHRCCPMAAAAKLV